MDIAIFILIIVALIGLFIVLMQWESRIKRRYKEKAISLLNMNDPNPKDVRETIKNLRLYVGKIRKDKEAQKLVGNLQDKYGHLL
jgi:hypothetical protein